MKERELGNQLVSSDMCLEVSTGQESWTLILNGIEYQKYLNILKQNKWIVAFASLLTDPGVGDPLIIVIIVEIRGGRAANTIW